MNDPHKKIKEALPEIEEKWDNEIISQLMEYIKIPNKSPSFDREWQQHGYMDKAMQLIVDWCKKQPIKNMKMELFRDENRTPLLFIDIPGQSDDTILLYGHMDKQPEMKGWDEDLGPWQPVIKGDKLYGRGSADDGYAVFCALTAIATLQRLEIPHANCKVIIEGSEESGSNDLPYYLEKLNDKVGSPSLVITLDSDCGNYDQLWGTTSLRGLVSGDLEIKALSQGIHSGMGGGIVPSPFNILRQLLDRIENTNKSEILLDELKTNIPKQRADQAAKAAQALGDDFYKKLPFINGCKPVVDDVKELILNQTWRSAISVTGIEGLPQLENAGNVALPDLTVKLSIRIPPTCDSEKASLALKEILESNPPYNAKVTFKTGDLSAGWHSPELSEWLAAANDKASQLFFNKPAAYLGGGGSIPFMGMLGQMYPQAQFLITGVLGPKSNAHGPNEFLHIPMVKKITGCVASVIASHFERAKKQ